MNLKDDAFSKTTPCLNAHEERIMKRISPFISLVAIVFCMALLPFEAKAEESAEVSTPVAMPPVAGVVEDATPALKDDAADALNQEESAKHAVTLPVAREEAGQGIDATIPVDAEAPAGAHEEATELEKEDKLVADEDAALLQAAPEAIDKKRDVADGDAKQTVSKARAIDCEPGECKIYADSAEYAMRYNKTELYLSGKNIVLENGTYNYNLYANAFGKMTYDNDLEILYQGVDGKYNLHYDIVDSDHHTMIVNGLFYNIMKTSPLLKRYSNRISDDSYSYQLDLRTNESLSFKNSLDYRFDGKHRDYSVNYNYDVATKKQSLVFSAGVSRGRRN